MRRLDPRAAPLNETMTSSRPYLIRAIYQWIVDNDMTPHVLVDASQQTVQVPREYVENGKIVLNVSPMAVQDLTLGNEEIAFNARFGGNPMTVLVPVAQVLAIYARENGQGMVFGEEQTPSPPQGPQGEAPAKPKLKVVK